MFFGSTRSEFRGRNERVAGGRSIPLRQKQEGARNQALASRPSVPHHSLNALIAFVSFVSFVTLVTLVTLVTFISLIAHWTLRAGRTLQTTRASGAELTVCVYDNWERTGNSHAPDASDEGGGLQCWMADPDGIGFAGHIAGRWKRESVWVEVADVDVVIACREVGTSIIT